MGKSFEEEESFFTHSSDFTTAEVVYGAHTREHHAVRERERERKEKKRERRRRRGTRQTEREREREKNRIF